MSQALAIGWSQSMRRPVLKPLRGIMRTSYT